MTNTRSLLRGLMVAAFAALSAASAAAGSGYSIIDSPTFSSPYMAAPETGYASMSDAASLVAASARAHGVNANLALAVSRVESNHSCRAVGRAGERGPMQVKPATARSVGVHGSLSDCRNSVEAGMRYLRLAVSTNGAGCAGISSYNRGVGAPGCSSYGMKVLRAMGMRVGERVGYGRGHMRRRAHHHRHHYHRRHRRR